MRLRYGDLKILHMWRLDTINIESHIPTHDLTPSSDNLGLLCDALTPWSMPAGEGAAWDAAGVPHERAGRQAGG